MQQVQFSHSGGTDSNDLLAEDARTVETAQERFNRLLAKQRAQAETAGMVEGILISFRRGLAARHGTHFDLDDIPDGALFLVTVQKGGGPEQVPADHLWALLPPIPQDNTAPR